MTDAPLPIRTRRTRRWRRVVAGSLMVGSLAFTTACGAAVADNTTFQSSGQSSGSTSSSSSSSSKGSGTTLGQGSTTTSHVTSTGS